MGEGISFALEYGVLAAEAIVDAHATRRLRLRGLRARRARRPASDGSSAVSCSARGSSTGAAAALVPPRGGEPARRRRSGSPGTTASTGWDERSALAALRRARDGRAAAAGRATAPLTPAPSPCTCACGDGCMRGALGRSARGPVTAAAHLETLLWRVGIRHVAGVDEVGHGAARRPGRRGGRRAAAGHAHRRRRRLEGADARRARAARGGDPPPRARASASAVVEPDGDRPREHLPGRARARCRRAVEALRRSSPASCWSTGARFPASRIPQSAYPKGDAFVCSIAAASIVAKVHRDAIMRELDARYPGLRLRAPHGLRDARRTSPRSAPHGPSPVHRRSFAPVRAARRRCRGGSSRLATVAATD